jgi:hypothetical protein
MEIASIPSGETGLDREPPALPPSKEGFSIVSYPLTPSEIAWLREQSRLVGEASIRFLAREAEDARSASNPR